MTESARKPRRTKWVRIEEQLAEHGEWRCVATYANRGSARQTAMMVGRQRPNLETFTHFHEVFARWRPAPRG